MEEHRNATGVAVKSRIAHGQISRSVFIQVSDDNKITTPRETSCCGLAYAASSTRNASSSSFGHGSMFSLDLVFVKIYFSSAGCLWPSLVIRYFHLDHRSVHRGGKDVLHCREKEHPVRALSSALQPA